MLHFRWSRSHVALSPWSWWRRRRRRPTGSWRRAGGKASSCSASRRVHPPPCPSTWTPQSAAQRLGAQVTKERKVKYPDEDFPNPEPEPLSAQICVLTSSFSHQNWRLLSDQQAAFYSFHLSTVIQLSRSREESESAKEQLSFSLKKTRTKEKNFTFKAALMVGIENTGNFFKDKKGPGNSLFRDFFLNDILWFAYKKPWHQIYFFCKRKRARQ